MKRIVAAGFLAGLMACTSAPVVVDAPLPVFRDTDAQIASQADVTADRLAGDWIIRQRFVEGAGPGTGMDLALLPNGALQWTFEGGECIDRVCISRVFLVLLEPTGPGRWKPVGPQTGLPDEEIWVMWMDFDSRTVALGTPSGQFGWIMDRKSTGGADRITAARDIMDWFGYDTDQLVEVTR